MRMSKETVVLKDGRLLIYYSFAGNSSDRSRGASSRRSCRGRSGRGKQFSEKR